MLKRSHEDDMDAALGTMPLTPPPPMKKTKQQHEEKNDDDNETNNTETKSPVHEAEVDLRMKSPCWHNEYQCEFRFIEKEGWAKFPHMLYNPLNPEQHKCDRKYFWCESPLLQQWPNYIVLRSDAMRCPFYIIRDAKACFSLFMKGYPGKASMLYRKDLSAITRRGIPVAHMDDIDIPQLEIRSSTTKTEYICAYVRHLTYAINKIFFGLDRNGCKPSSASYNTKAGVVMPDADSLVLARHSSRAKAYANSMASQYGIQLPEFITTKRPLLQMTVEHITQGLYVWETNYPPDDPDKQKWSMRIYILNICYPSQLNQLLFKTAWTDLIARDAVEGDEDARLLYVAPTSLNKATSSSSSSSSSSKWPLPTTMPTTGTIATVTMASASSSSSTSSTSPMITPSQSVVRHTIDKNVHNRNCGARAPWQSARKRKEFFTPLLLPAIYYDVSRIMFPGAHPTKDRRCQALLFTFGAALHQLDHLPPGMLVRLPALSPIEESKDPRDETVEPIGSEQWTPEQLANFERIKESLLALLTKEEKDVFHLKATHSTKKFDLHRHLPSISCRLCSRGHTGNNAFLTITPENQVEFHCHASPGRHCLLGPIVV
jgi:hypothetical protein